MVTCDHTDNLSNDYLCYRILHTLKNIVFFSATFHALWVVAGFVLIIYFVFWFISAFGL